MDCGLPTKECFLTPQNVSEGKFIVPSPKIGSSKPKEERKSNYDPHFSGGSKESRFGLFNPTLVEERLFHFWNQRDISQQNEFGKETLTSHTLMSEILTDRFTLIQGFQLLRDELQFAGIDKERIHQSKLSQISFAKANLSIPSVVSTQAYTNCGDRFNSEFHSLFHSAVSSRFATISETGSLKTEAFFPTGGGTDDGKTFAHVTVAHTLNDLLKRAVYEGNPSSFTLINFDLFTHCGKSSPGESLLIGVAGESGWRDRRAACGAIVGCLKAYNNDNPVHRRIRSDLGEANFELLSTKKIFLDDGETYMNYLVAAAIVSIQGMINTAKSCLNELDERGVAHLTANLALNKKSSHEGLFSLYFGRATVFNGKITIQSFGTDASKYSGVLVQVGSAKRFQLFYDSKVSIPILGLADFEKQNSQQ